MLVNNVTRRPFWLREGEHVIGRGKLWGVKDEHCSRKQVRLRVTGDGRVLMACLGRNASGLKRCVPGLAWPHPNRALWHCRPVVARRCD